MGFFRHIITFGIGFSVGYLLSHDKYHQNKLEIELNNKGLKIADKKIINIDKKGEIDIYNGLLVIKYNKDKT